MVTCVKTVSCDGTKLNMSGHMHATVTTQEGSCAIQEGTWITFSANECVPPAIGARVNLDGQWWFIQGIRHVPCVVLSLELIRPVLDCPDCEVTMIAYGGEGATECTNDTKPMSSSGSFPVSICEVEGTKEVVRGLETCRRIFEFCTDVPTRVELDGIIEGCGSKYRITEIVHDCAMKQLLTFRAEKL